VGTLQSPTIDPTNTSTCFQFYYFIYGDNTGSITLSLINRLSKNLIWKRARPAGDMWHSYMIDIPPQNISFKVYNLFDLNLQSIK
jgi:hypothetical protein